MRALGFLGGLSIIGLLYCYSQLFDGTSEYGLNLPFHHKHHHHKPKNAHEITQRCRALRTHAGPPDDFLRSRSVSDRFEEGTKAVLIKNARIWTGKRNGTQVIEGDILLDKGIIKSIGHLDVASASDLLGYSNSEYASRLVVVDAEGAWVTPGIVDVHSHLGDYSSPAMQGATDANSFQGTIEPWLRSLDALNTHDTYPLSIAGGVTTSLILPGSGNAIGMFATIFSS